MDAYCGTEAFYNAGLFRKWMTSGSTGFDIAMNNTGVVDVESGAMDFQNTFSQAGGTWELGLNGAGNNGQINFSGAASLAASLMVHLNNGYMLGLSNSFTLLNYPSYTGTFGATNLPPGGTSWKLNVGPSASTLVLTNLNAPQNVAITSPANNQPFTIPVNIPITATATDPYAPISSIQFYQGTNLLGQVLNSPYTFTWNSVQPGTYVLSALATDTAGAVATSAPVTITVYYNHAQTTNYTWTGASSTDWFTPGNWSPNGVPGVLDNATMANNGTINLLNNVSINNFTLTSGTLAGTGILTPTNATVWNGGTVAGSVTLPANSTLTVSGGVTLNGLLVNNGTINLSNGTVYGNAAGTITNNGLCWSQSGNSALNNGVVVNNGILRVAAANGNLSLGASQTFLNNGTVDAENGSIIFYSGGTLAGTYNAAPAGGIYFSAGTFALGALPILSGSGIFQFNGGTLNVASTVPPVLQLAAGTVVPGPVFQNAGAISNLTLAGSTLYGTNTITGTMNWTAGSLNGRLTVGSTGVLTVSSGNNKLVYGSSLVNSGQIIWTGGYIYGDGNSEMTNNGVWLDETDGQIDFGNGNSTFVNNGLFEKTNSAGTTYFYNLVLVNNGTLDAESGAIVFENGGTLGGTYNAAAGAAIDFASGTFTLGAFPVLTGAGIVQLNGGTMNIATNIPPNLQLKGGTFTLGPAFQNGGAINNLTNQGATLSGAYTVTGTMTWLSGAANGSLTIASNATLNLPGSAIELGNCAFTNNGTVVWSSGQIHGNAATLFINNGLCLASANNYFDNGDGGVFGATNNGVFRNLSGTTTFSGATFANFGLVDVEGGAVTFNYGGTLAGTYNVSQYSDLYFNGGAFTAQAPPVITGPGLAQFTGGTLTLLADQIAGLPLVGGNVAIAPSFQNNGAITNLTIAGSTLIGTNLISGTLNWTAGGLNGSRLIVETNAVLNLMSGNAKNLGNSVLVNNGTVLWSGGALQGNSGTFITNNGLWLIQTDNAINNNVCCGMPTFVNNGTLTKSGTFGTTTLSEVSVINSGTFDIESGAISLINSSTYGQTEATLTVGVAAPNLQGQLIVPGPVSLDGALNVHFLNGYTPNAGDLLQPIFYGSSSGAFANLNLPTLAAGQSWNLEYGGGSVSLTVIGPSTNATNTLLISGSVTGTGNQAISNVTVYATLNASNLIQNGSFEEPSIGGTAYTLYSVGSTNVTNWTVIGRAGANVALSSFNWIGPAEDGDQFMDPTGSTGGGGVAQTFATVAGTSYNMTFYHGTYSHTGLANSLAVGVGTNLYTFGETSGGGGNLDWRQIVIPFTATSNFTTLSFSDNTGYDANDNFVDNVQVLPAGAGSIAQTLTDSNGNYQLTVPNGTLVVGVSGLPAAGYNPVATKMVNMANANQVVNFTTTAAAVPQQFTITTAVLPAGAGTSSGDGTFSSGATVTVNATAITTTLPYSFSAWTENGVFQSSSASYSFTAIRNRALVANFVLPTFTVSVSNNPAPAGTISGAGTFSYGATNVLTATPNFGYFFTNWTEGATIVGTNSALTNVIFANHTYVANYTAANVTHVVTTATSPPGLAAIAGAGTYINGQTANFNAPLSIISSPNIYTFQEFTLSNTLASYANSFGKTFSTLDPTNLQYVAVYAASSILPLLTHVTVNYAPLVPSTTNFVLQLQFNRSMLTNISPIIVLTNSAAANQPVVATNGSWSGTLINNDTYSTPPITISPGMDGTMQLYVSAAQDTNGDALALTNAGQFTIEATPPANPILTQVSSNSSSIAVGWSSYNAPADLAGFRVYIQPANYSSAAGLSVLTGLSPGARSYQFNNLSLDTSYYVAVQAVDTAGNSLSAVTPLKIILPSSLPPAVGINVAAVGASSALVSWNSYNTSGLLGFAGYYVFYQQTDFTSVAGLTPQATLGPSQRSYQVNALDRTKTNYFAVVGFNAASNFYPLVFTTAWTDPYGGAISVNTTIGGSAPGVVAIYHSITVANNATLTIQPGTTLLFTPGTSLTVAQGTLNAAGTSLAPIIMDSANDVSGSSPAPGDWGGVTLNSGAGASSLQFVEILYGAGLTLNGCSPSVQALTANFNTPTGLLAKNGATLTTANALLSGNQVGAQQSDTATLNIGGSVIQNNVTNAWAAGSASLNAASDWWGTATQSSLTPLLAGNVAYTPFLTSEPVLTPAIGTSNGVTQIGVSPVILQLACRTATSMRLSEDFTFSGVFFTPFSNYAAFPLSAGGGLKHIFAQFRSVTGLTNTPVELDVTFITQGPVIQSFSLSDGENLSRPLTITASATATLGMYDVEFYLDGVGVATNLGGSFSYYFDVRTLNNAVHQTEIIARDTAGNIATLEEGVIVAVTPPLAPTITAPSSDYVTNNSNLTIRGTAEANINIHMTANGQILGSTTTDGNGNFSVASATLSEGLNSIVAVASDSTGSTPSPTRHITVETILPVAVIMNAPAYNQSTGLTISWSQAASGKQPSTFQLFWATSSFTTTNQATGHSVASSSLFDTLQGLATGTYYFGVVGFDGAGNPSPLSALVSSVYDPTPPSLSIAYGSPSPVGVGVVNITLASSKALAGVPSLTLRPNGATSPSQLTLTNVALNTWQTAFVVTNSTPSGVAAVAATAQDQVGNVFNGAPAGAMLVIDTTPPAANIVTAPPGPVQTISGANVAVNLTLTKPAAQSTTPTLSFKPPQGAIVPLTLAGSGTNWNATLALTAAMGSGFGQFAFSSQDSVGNVGTNITTGGQLELYNTANPSPPAAPTNFVATSLPGGYIALTWNGVGNAQIYRLYREAGKNFVLPGTLDVDNITATTVTDLPPADGLYSYGISASRLGSESAISNVLVAVSDSTPPPAPINVAVQLATAGVQITWQQPSGETPDHYVIYRNGVVIQSVGSIMPVTDYPPRGTDAYIVAAVDLVGNQNPSIAASIQLLVSPVNNLSVLAAVGQAAALTWSSTDSTVTGYNLYRNGVKQNSSPLTTPAYTDLLPVNDVVSYGVTALNASSQESPPRVVHVSPVGMGLAADGGQPLLVNYFDSVVVTITNLSPTAPLPLTQFVLNRAITGVEPLAVTQAVTSINASASSSQVVVLPESSVVANQTMTVNVFQQTDSEGDNVVYQQTFQLTNSQLPGTEIAVSANQLPLAGGLTSFQVNIINQGYTPMQVIVSRGFNAKPGDVYISVRNNLGQEVSRTPFQGTPPGTTFASDGIGYINIATGASLSFAVPNVLTPEALAGTTNVIFAAVASNIYNQIETPAQVVSGPLSGTMVAASLALPPYYGTSQTDHTGYSNAEPVVISGQAISQSTGLPVANAALNIGFATRGYQWYQAVTTDANGNYQYTYNPPPGFGGTLNIWAAHPLVVDKLNQNTITVSRMYCTPSGEDIEMSKNGTLNFSIQLINPGDTALTAVTTDFSAYQVSGTNLTPITSVHGTNLTGSSFTIAPNQSMTVNLELAADTTAPSSVQVDFTFTSALGASVTLAGSVDLLPAVPVLTVPAPSTGYLEVSLNRGDQTSGQLTVMNSGLATLSGITVLPPTNSWIALNLPVSSDGLIHLPDLAVGQSNIIGVVFSPPTSTPLAYYPDTVTVQATNLGTPYAINVYARVTSDLTGGVQFEVDDILGEQVSGASVRLNNGLLAANVGPFYTDTNGLVTVSNLEEGTWNWEVTAPGCSANVGTVTVVSDQVAYQPTRLNRSLVTVSFSVVPVPFSDQYTIQVEQTFETYVPAGVLVLQPPAENFNNVTAGFQASFICAAQNYGLVQMTDLTIGGSQSGQAVITPLITYIPVLLPEQIVDIPMVFTYGATTGVNAPQGAAQTRQGANVVGCVGGAIAGAFGFGDVMDPSFVGGLAAILNAHERCVKDNQLQNAGAALAALYGFAQLANDFSDAASVVAGVAAQAVGCMIGNLLAGIGGSTPGSGSYGNSPDTFIGQPVGCFAPDTLVRMADGTDKQISAISTHDIVKTGLNPWDVATVEQVLTLSAENTCSIQFYDPAPGAPDHIVATPEHLFWVDGQGWRPAGTLKRGDWLFNARGERVRVASNTPLSDSMKVYTLGLLGDGAFYANGVLVHDLCGAAARTTTVLQTKEAAK
ncbi:MAG TPA: Ig-like domain-containing protein [Candidatus Saccharimonadales bacterium]|nr:Ig-like domain-containing protein [Candidatus Saccharimonadales bacterium]